MISTPISHIVEEDDRTIGGFNDALKIGFKCATFPSPWMISTLEIALNPPFTSTLCYKEVLTFSTGRG